MKPARKETSLGSLPEMGRVFQQAVDQVVESVRAERVALLFGEASEEPRLRACYGLPAEHFWQLAPLSLELLRQVKATGEAVNILDVRSTAKYRQSSSMAIAGISSVLCTPIWGRSGAVAGVLYADWTGGKADSAALMVKLQAVAHKLERFLHQLEAGQSGLQSPFDGPDLLGKSKAPQASQPRFQQARSAPISRIAHTFSSPGALAKVLYFRSLSALLEAGLPIAQGLWVLCKESSPRMRLIAEEIARRVERGQSLSEACLSTGAFTQIELGFMKVGENTGQLAPGLLRLARLGENDQARRRRLTSAMIYPCFVLVACLLFLLLAPAAMLSSQVQLLKDLHTDLPWASRLFVSGVDFFFRPVTVFPVALAVAALLRSARQRQRMGSVAGSVLLKLGPARRIWTAYVMCQWCQTLSLQLESGVSLVDGLALTAEVVRQDFEFSKRTLEVRESILQGEVFWRSLQASGFPGLLREMVAAGEECGQLPQMLNWLSTYYEEEFSSAIEGFSRLLEPVVLLILGVAAATVMILTLSPMLKALQQL